MVEGRGRRLAAPAVPDDDGRADPVLTTALAAYDAAPEALDRWCEVLSVLTDPSHDRLLVPVVAVLGEAETDAAGLVHDKSSDMAAVLLTGADGRRALLAFTSLETLARWDPAARPVPVRAALAAVSAVQEDAAALVVDVAGPVRFVVQGDDLTALGAGYRMVRLDDGRHGWARVGG
ncbi:SseB family protein [Nocardioides sp. TRM66260-LWL]|uniref:SseB family protein n=1 Tax=Nocardioides sp. TRM66260-LWL TaxID=2874478 RepID=UPI001CC6E5A0|nr:SseB family protein [Nocardioides sp. TRM66260-LWL]MBZ5733878.1 SseB family protein [Nocardioides sp. TRM66260-LWL]